jgi:hypothetical protein
LHRTLGKATPILGMFVKLRNHSNSFPTNHKNITTEIGHRRKEFMHLKPLLVLSLLFVVFITFVGQALGQTYTSGVKQGDIFTYDFNISWSSTNPNVQTPQSWIDQNITRSVQVSVSSVSGSIITGTTTYNYANGTSETLNLTADVSRGGELQLYFIASNLGVNDALGTSFYSSKYRINETISKSYSGSIRETNHMRFEGSTNYDYYYDKSTGALVEYFYQINQKLTDQNNNPYNTTVLGSYKINYSSVWVVSVIPEFPSTIIVSFLMAAIVLTAIFYRGKQYRLKQG